jgi:hypothetical protein
MTRLDAFSLAHKPSKVLKVEAGVVGGSLDGNMIVQDHACGTAVRRG